MQAKRRSGSNLESRLSEPSPPSTKHQGSFLSICPPIFCHDLLAHFELHVFGLFELEKAQKFKPTIFVQISVSELYLWLRPVGKESSLNKRLDKIFKFYIKETLNNIRKGTNNNRSPSIRCLYRSCLQRCSLLSSHQLFFVLLGYMYAS